MYDAVADVQEKNDESCGCTMQLHMYKRNMMKNKLQKEAVNLQYVPTQEHVADVLTKPLSRVQFEYFRDKLGVVRKDSLKRGSDSRWQKDAVVVAQPRIG